MIKKFIRRKIRIAINPKAMNQLVISSFILASVLNSCNYQKHFSKNYKVEIPDSLMHFIKIDSSNKEHLRMNLGDKYKIYECNLKREKLMEIEKMIYRRISKDSLYQKTNFIDKFNETHRQYIILNDIQNSYLYIRYTYFANGKWNSPYWQKNKSNLDKYITGIINKDTFQFGCSILLTDPNVMHLMLYSL